MGVLYIQRILPPAVSFRVAYPRGKLHSQKENSQLDLRREQVAIATSCHNFERLLLCSSTGAAGQNPYTLGSAGPK